MWQPLRASSRQQARPIPELAPVTNATESLMLVLFAIFVLWCGLCVVCYVVCSGMAPLLVL